LEYIGIIFAALLSSGVIAAIVSSNLLDKRDIRILTRNKIEEIYLSFADWNTGVSTHYLKYLDVGIGKISFNDALDMDIANPDHTMGDKIRGVKMNIMMYEPSLQLALEAVESCIARMNETHAK